MYEIVALSEAAKTQIICYSERREAAARKRGKQNGEETGVMMSHSTCVTFMRVSSAIGL